MSDNTILAAIAADALALLDRSADHPEPSLPLDALLGGNEQDETAGKEQSPLILADEGALLQPVFDPINEFVDELHNEMVMASEQIGAETIVTTFTKFGESLGPSNIGDSPNVFGPSNLVTDVLNLPGNIVEGNFDSIIDNLGSDIDQSQTWAHYFKDSIVFGPDVANPVPELISSAGSALQSIPLLSIGGNDGLIGGNVGSLAGSSSGHLIDLDIGPQTPEGLVLDLLSAPDQGSGHLLELNVLDVGATGPSLVDLDLLSGNSGINDNLFDLPHLI